MGQRRPTEGQKGSPYHYYLLVSMLQDVCSALQRLPSFKMRVVGGGGGGVVALPPPLPPLAKMAKYGKRAMVNNLSYRIFLKVGPKIFATIHYRFGKTLAEDAKVRLIFVRF